MLKIKNNLSVIIPVFNEEKTITEIIKKVLKQKIVKEVIVVDDGSYDKTKQVLKTFKHPCVKICFHQKNQGKGAAIRTAAKEVCGDYVIVQDADLEYDPLEYERLIQPIKDGKAEIVYGSRFTGEHRNLLFWNLLANKLLNLVANILYNTTLSDLETCYKVFRADIFKSLTWHANRFDFEPEITVRILKRGIYIYEVPISYTGRNYQEGKKICVMDAIVAFWTLLKYRFVD